MNTQWTLLVGSIVFGTYGIGVVVGYWLRGFVDRQRGNQ